MAPVREKIRELEEEKEKLSRERSEMEAESWSAQEHLRVTYEGVKKSSDTISRCVRTLWLGVCLCVCGWGCGQVPAGGEGQSHGGV